MKRKTKTKENKSKYMENAKDDFKSVGSFIRLVQPYLESGKGFEVRAYDENRKKTKELDHIIDTTTIEDTLCYAVEFYVSPECDDFLAEHEGEDYFTKKFVLEQFYVKALYYFYEDKLGCRFFGWIEASIIENDNN